MLWLQDLPLRGCRPQRPCYPGALWLRARLPSEQEVLSQGLCSSCLLCPVGVGTQMPAAHAPPPLAPVPWWWTVEGLAGTICMPRVLGWRPWVQCPADPVHFQAEPRERFPLPSPSWHPGLPQRLCFWLIPCSPESPEQSWVSHGQSPECQGSCTGRQGGGNPWMPLFQQAQLGQGPGLA